MKKVEDAKSAAKSDVKGKQVGQVAKKAGDLKASSQTDRPVQAKVQNAKAQVKNGKQ